MTEYTKIEKKLGLIAEMTADQYITRNCNVKAISWLGRLFKALGLTKYEWVRKWLFNANLQDTTTTLKDLLASWKKEVSQLTPEQKTELETKVANRWNALVDHYNSKTTHKLLDQTAKIILSSAPVPAAAPALEPAPAAVADAPAPAPAQEPPVAADKEVAAREPSPESNPEPAPAPIPEPVAAPVQAPPAPEAPVVDAAASEPALAPIPEPAPAPAHAPVVEPRSPEVSADESDSQRPRRARKPRGDAPRAASPARTPVRAKSPEPSDRHPPVHRSKTTTHFTVRTPKK